jgi:hypothetical protein
VVAEAVPAGVLAVAPVVVPGVVPVAAAPVVVPAADSRLPSR